MDFFFIITVEDRLARGVINMTGGEVLITLLSPGPLPPLCGRATPSLPRIPPPYMSFCQSNRGDNPLNKVFV